MKAAVLALILFCGQYDTNGFHDEIDVGFIWFSREHHVWQEVVGTRGRYCQVMFETYHGGWPCYARFWMTKDQITYDSDLWPR